MNCVACSGLYLILADLVYNALHLTHMLQGVQLLYTTTDTALYHDKNNLQGHTNAIDATE
jgi:hypothetical protein